MREVLFAPKLPHLTKFVSFIYIIRGWWKNTFLPLKMNPKIPLILLTFLKYLWKERQGVLFQDEDLHDLQGLRFPENSNSKCFSNLWELWWEIKINGATFFVIISKTFLWNGDAEELLFFITLKFASRNACRNGVDFSAKVISYGCAWIAMMANVRMLVSI